MQAQYVRHVSGNVERHNLPSSVTHDFVALRKPIQNKAAPGRTIPFADDILSCVEVSHLNRQV